MTEIHTQPIIEVADLADDVELACRLGSEAGWLRILLGQIKSYDSSSFLGVPNYVSGRGDILLGPLNLAAGNNDVYVCPAGKRAAVITANLHNSTGASITMKSQFKRGGIYYELPVNGTAMTTTVNANSVSIGQFAFTILEEGDAFSMNASAIGINAWVRIVELPDDGPLLTARLFAIPDTDTVLYTCPDDHVAFPLVITQGFPQIAPFLHILNKSGASCTLGVYSPIAGSTVSALANRISSFTIADSLQQAANTTSAVPPFLIAQQSVVVKAAAAGAGAIFLNMCELPLVA